MRNSAGVVTVSGDGQRVLLRRPTSTEGYADGWTHAKGGADAGESPAQAAVREALEELGAVVELREQIPGSWAGDYTETVYFLARFDGAFVLPDAETAEVRWFGWDAAALAIAGGTSPRAMARDLAVLALARAMGAL